MVPSFYQVIKVKEDNYTVIEYAKYGIIIRTDNQMWKMLEQLMQQHAKK